MTASQDVQDSFNDSLNLQEHIDSPFSLRSETTNRKCRCSYVIEKVYMKALCPESATDSSPNTGGIPKFTGFLTAGSNREIRVSEDALNSARSRLYASECDAQEDATSIDSDAKGFSTGFAGFVTAGTSKLITVSDSALKLAKRRLNGCLEDPTGSTTNVGADTENRDPAGVPVPSLSSDFARVSPSGIRSTKPATKQTEFVSPLLRKSPRSTRSTHSSSITPVSRSSRNRHNPPFRTPSAVVESPSVSRGSTPMPSRPPTSLLSSERSALAAGKVEVQAPKSLRITCIRDLRSCSLDVVDFLGIVVGSGAHSRNPNNVPAVKVADRYGESVHVELLSSSIPANISTGSVISIEGAVIKRSEGSISLLLNDSAFVDLEPNDPEAECLHRLFRTGLFDVTPSEDDFTFDGTALRVIGRLNEFSSEASTVMARICKFRYDALTYLGHMPGRIFERIKCYCHFLQAEIADFSGVIAVHFSDEAAERLIGKPAGGMVKLRKDLLQTKLSPLYYRPMLFRISLQNSRWFIDDWKHLEIPRFKLFLKNIAEQKGYK
ncbi:hypothetical protein OSTOST_15795 [Ostertagia ostertagi]